MDDIAQALQDRLGATPTIGVVGLGYVGLPLAVAFARSGATVVGVDLDARRVAAVNGATSFIEDVTGETLRPLVTSGRLTASDDVLTLKVTVNNADIAEVIAILYGGKGEDQGLSSSNVLTRGIESGIPVGP